MMRRFLLILLFSMWAMPSMAANSISVDGVTIDYDKATETSKDPAQQKFIESYKLAWADTSPKAMHDLVDSKSLCEKIDSSTQKEYIAAWIDAARGMQGNKWPRNSKLHFIWVPWKNINLDGLLLVKRGLASYPVQPKYILGIAALDPKYFSKEKPEDYYSHMNFLSIAQSTSGELRIAFPCLNDKGIEKAKTKTLNK